MGKWEEVSSLVVLFRKPFEAIYWMQQYGLTAKFLFFYGKICYVGCLTQIQQYGRKHEKIMERRKANVQTFFCWLPLIAIPSIEWCSLVISRCKTIPLRSSFQDACVYWRQGISRTPRYHWLKTRIKTNSFRCLHRSATTTMMMMNSTLKISRQVCNIKVQ